MAKGIGKPRGRPLQDLTGKTFGRLTVLRRGQPDPNSVYWICRCECRSLVEVSGSNLRRGATLSCGCLNSERTTDRNTKHGMARTPEHSAWLAIKQRCYNLNHPKYEFWGGRGIRMAAAWIDDFQAFYDHIGPKPSPKHVLDRIDNEGHYEPGNIRWTTHRIQQNNRRARRWRRKPEE